MTIRRWPAVLMTILALTVLSPAPSRAAPTAHTLQLSSIRMITPMVGWGLTGCAVFRTADGGNRWKNVTPGNFACIPGFPASANGAFLDGAHAWVAAIFAHSIQAAHRVAVFRTADGGRTWYRSVIPSRQFVVEGATDLDFLDGRHGWIVLGLGVGAGQAEFELYRTVDGGAHWTRVMHAGGVHPTAGALPGCDCFGGVSFVTPSTGWAGGQFFAGPSQVYLFRTGDGGYTWRRAKLTIPGGIDPMSVRTDPPRFFGARPGLLPVFWGNNRFVLYRTDGGASWQRTTPIRFGAPNGSHYWILDARHAWFTNGATLWTTDDGGGRWSALRPDHPLLGDIQFLSLRTGFLLYSFAGPDARATSLFRTDNGGRHWARLYPQG